MPPNISTDDFLTLFDEFKKVSSATLKAYIVIASRRVPLSTWGDNCTYATALMTAHMLTARGQSGAGSTGGAVTAESVGDLSRAYATVFEAGSGDAELMTTRYGIDFVALRNESFSYGMVTGPRRGC